MYLVADGLQPATVGSCLESGDGIADCGVGKVHPADHAGDEVRRLGGGQEDFGLLQARDGLHYHGLVDSLVSDERAQLDQDRGHP